MLKSRFERNEIVGDLSKLMFSASSGGLDLEYIYWTGTDQEIFLWSYIPIDTFGKANRRASRTGRQRVLDGFFDFFAIV